MLRIMYGRPQASVVHGDSFNQGNVTTAFPSSQYLQHALPHRAISWKTTASHRHRNVCLLISFDLCQRIVHGSLLNEDPFQISPLCRAHERFCSY